MDPAWGAGRAAEWSGGGLGCLAAQGSEHAARCCWMLRSSDGGVEDLNQVRGTPFTYRPRVLLPSFTRRQGGSLYVPSCKMSKLKTAMWQPQKPHPTTTLSRDRTTTPQKRLIIIIIAWDIFSGRQPNYTQVKNLKRKTDNEKPSLWSRKPTIGVPIHPGACLGL